MIKTLTFLLFVFVIYLGCKKQDIQPKYSITHESSLIQNAKEYFYKNIPLNTFSGQRSVNSSDSFNVDKLEKKVLWNNAVVFHRDKRVMVVVPIKFNSTVFQHASFNNKLFKQRADDMTRLIIYQDSSSKYRILLSSYLPDFNYLNNPNGSFSGMSVIKDWSGNILAAFKYSNDSTYIMNTDNSTQIDSVETNIAQPPPGDITVATCTYIDYYTQVSTPYGTDISYTSTSLIGCTYSYAATGSPSYIYQLSQIGIDSKAVGGGTKVYTPSFDSIYLDPSVKGNELCVIKQLSSAGLKSCLSSIISFFDASSVADINISVVRSFPDGSSAETTPTKYVAGGITTYTFNTKLSDNKLAYASQEYVGETILHEVLHSWIDYNSGVMSNLNGHYTMLSSFVDDEVNALQQMYPYLTNAAYGNDALCIVLAGLINDPQLNSAFVSQILADRNVTASQVNNTNALYQSGKKGVQCSNTPVQ